MITVGTYLTIFKVGDEIMSDEKTKRTIRRFEFRGDELTVESDRSILNNHSPYYLHNIHVYISAWHLTSLNKVIELNKDKVRDYKIENLLS